MLNERNGNKLKMGQHAPAQNIMGPHSMIYFAPGPWQGLWRNRHQLMSRFARLGHKVLFVERRTHLRSAWSAWRNGTVDKAEFQNSLVQQVDENLYVLRYPLWTPVSGRLPLRWVTRTLRARILRHTLQQLGMSNPIVWYSQPSMHDLVHEIPTPKLAIYHVVDEYSAYSGQSAHHSQREQQLEAQMFKLVDAVVVVSQKLFETKSVHHPHTYLVPNGVDFDAYAQALTAPELPADLAGIPSPRIGYSGLIGDRLNLPMLYELAVAHPAWSLVLIGEARLTEQANIWVSLLGLPNVHYLGEKPVAQVPHYLKGFDVGMMPYQQNREAEYISPLKLYDYLAAGAAVASVEIPAIESFRGCIHIAQHAGDFGQAVAAALADGGAEAVAARRAVAAQHTWDARVQQLGGMIEQQLERLARNGNSAYQSHTTALGLPKAEMSHLHSSQFHSK